MSLSVFEGDPEKLDVFCRYPDDRIGDQTWGKVEFLKWILVPHLFFFFLIYILKIKKTNMEIEMKVGLGWVSMFFLASVGLMGKLWRKEYMGHL